MRELPDAVKNYLEGYISTGDDLRKSSRAHVYVFRHAYRCGRYLKIRNTVDGRPDEATLESEAIAVQWLQEQSWVPHLVYYGNQDEIEYLITDEIPGSSSENERFQSDIPQLLRM